MKTNRRPAQESDPPASGARLPYRRPSLTTYGPLRFLTAGGSGLEPEPQPPQGNQPPNRFP